MPGRLAVRGVSQPAAAFRRRAARDTSIVSASMLRAEGGRESPQLRDDLGRWMFAHLWVRSPANFIGERGMAGVSLWIQLERN